MAVAANNFILRQQQQHQSKNPGMIGSQNGPLPSSLGPAGAANAALMTSFLQQLQAAGQQPGGSPGVAPVGYFNY
ncbi:hypothetical protein Ddc_11828 [Ditylenchus destructor]|nr:hypothetical protein Ddc_11828 [Ditylenchus destructor]